MIKKLLILLTSVLVIGTASYFLTSQSYHQLSKTTPSTLTAKSLIPTPTATPIPVETPTKINIPKLNLSAVVEDVGLDSQNRMDVPIHASDVGWYKLGPKPGEKGNAVIDGHLDTVTGAPAVFWSLSNLQSGDHITVTDKSNRQYVYKVTDVKVYPFDQFPLKEVFGETNKYQLNLITCAGQFNNAAHNYSQRTVVYSELIQ